MSLRSVSRTTGSRTVNIRIGEGIDLAKKDIFGHSDPYVRIRIHNGWTRNTPIQQEYVTKTVKKTLSPKWEQDFKADLVPSANLIAFDVFDENRLTRDDFLGQFTLLLKDVNDIPTLPSSDSSPGLKVPCKLLPRSNRSNVRGKILIYLKYIGNIPGSVAIAASRNSTASMQRQESSTLAEGGWEVVEEAQPLPSGWEEKMDGNGRVFFVDHANRRTQWDRPTVSSTSAAASGAANAASASGPPPIPPRVRRQVSEDHATQHSVAGPTPVPAPRRSVGQRSPSVQSTTAAASQPPANAASTNNELIGDRRIALALVSPLPSGWAAQMANGRPFFVDHTNRTTSWDDPRLKNFSAAEIAEHTRLVNEHRRQMQSQPNTASTRPLPPGWEERRTADGRAFYIDHSTRSTQWDDPREQQQTLEKANVPQYSRDYKQKYDYLKSKLKPPASGTPNRFELKVRRNNILEDSYRGIATLGGTKREIMKARLWIDFTGEKGLDYGGLAREWFELLSREMFNPYYGLFECSASDNYTLQINPNSGACNEEHLSYFKFIGRVCGMAVYHGKLVDGFFVRPFYKMMLRKRILLADMESVDSEYYSSLKWILDNDPEDLDMHFCVDEELFGQVSMKELKPGGEDIAVTNANKKEYVDLVIQWRFMNRIKKQMDSFTEGFQELVPYTLYKMFDERELELLMCGIDQIDVDDWRKNSRYRGRYHDQDQVIIWFWKAVATFDNEMRARLLQFVTGTSRVPMNGFAHLHGSNGEQKFCIEPWGDERSLPRAHTCFNRIDLPPYSSYHLLREKLQLAIENTEGFEGVD